jgi:cytochrome c5
MSSPQEHTEEHVPSIKTPKQLAVVIVLAFLLPILVITLLVNLVTANIRYGAGSDMLTPEATNKRIAPVAAFELVDANAPKVYKTGEQVFNAVCTSCHTAGVAGAPKLGDKVAWAPFIKAGFDSMLNVALHGKGAMPAKGGNPALSDYEVARAVVYMSNQSGASLPDPPEPAQNTPQPVMASASALPAPPPATQPTPSVTGVASPPSPEATVNPAGEKLYKSHYFACHDTGIAGAPKFGNKMAWEPYIKTGLDAMVKVALMGKGAMPPKGGAVNASEEDIRAAIQYMVNAAK